MLRKARSCEGQATIRPCPYGSIRFQDNSLRLNYKLTSFNQRLKIRICAINQNTVSGIVHLIYAHGEQRQREQILEDTPINEHSRLYGDGEVQIYRGRTALVVRVCGWTVG